MLLKGNGNGFIIGTSTGENEYIIIYNCIISNCKSPTAQGGFIISGTHLKSSIFIVYNCQLISCEFTSAVINYSGGVA